MFSKITKFGVLASAGIALTLSAHAAQPTLTLSAVNGYSDVENGLDSKRKNSWGASMYFDAPLAEALSLGFGGLYYKRTFEIGNGTVRLERQVPTLFVPLEVKLWLGNVLTLGGGAFGAVRVGDQTDRVLVGNTTTFSFSSNQRESIEYGWTASAGLTLPLSGRSGIAIDGRYLHGLRDAAKDSLYKEEIRDLAFMAGIRVSL